MSAPGGSWPRKESLPPSMERGTGLDENFTHRSPNMVSAYWLYFSAMSSSGILRNTSWRRSSLVARNSLNMGTTTVDKLAQEGQYYDTYLIGPCKSVVSYVLATVLKHGSVSHIAYQTPRTSGHPSRPLFEISEEAINELLPSSMIERPKSSYVPPCAEFVLLGAK